VTKPFEPIGTFSVLSYGGGVQSTALLIAAVLGKIPRPDVAIFADTGWEPKQVISWIQVGKNAADIARRDYYKE